jgi:hypothetical protein
MNRRSFLRTIVLGLAAAPAILRVHGSSTPRADVPRGTKVAHRLEYLESLGWTWWSNYLWRPSQVVAHQIVREGPFGSWEENGITVVYLPDDSLCTPSGFAVRRLNPRWLAAGVR